MKTQIPNINIVRSAWRRIKKDIKDAIIRDLKPVKDVKGSGGAYGPTLPTGWELAATADFNGDGYPDYALYKGATRQTA